MRQHTIMNSKLILIQSGENKTFTIHEGVNIVGRDSSSDIQVVSEKISRSHAKITLAGESCIIEDLKSANGTLVNDKKISQVKLNNGDEIKISEHILHFVTEEEDEPISSTFVPRVFSDRSLYATIKAKPAPAKSINTFFAHTNYDNPATKKGKIVTLFNRLFRKSQR